MDRTPELVAVDAGATGALDPVLLLQACRDALADVGARGVSDGEIIATFGRDAVAAFDHVLAPRGHERPVAVQAARVFAAIVVRDLAERRHPPAADARHGLARLHAAGIPVILVSDHPTAVVEGLLLRHGWQRHVVTALSTDRVEADRPAPDILDEAMGRVGLREARLVANVAAHHAHLQAGRAAGVGCNVAVGWTAATPAAGRLADVVAPHLGVVAEILVSRVACAQADESAQVRRRTTSWSM